MKELKIYTVTHKIPPILHNQLYVCMQGGIGETINESFLRDNFAENIAEKNIFYSELSSAYWLWKNVKDVDYIGLAHYRRFLNIYPNLFEPKKNIEYYTTKTFAATKLFKTEPHFQQKKIIQILEKGYIILPKKIKLKNNVYKHYQESHYIEHLDLTIEILNSLFPEYNKSMQKVINCNELYICNMFISTKKFWDDYHQWLFKILFELESKIIIPNDIYQRRVFSFLSERLLNVYIEKNKPNKKEFSIMFIEY